MFWFLSSIAHLLMGAAFVMFGVRNLKNIPRLTAVLEAKKISQPENAAKFGVGLQIAGGALTFLGAFVGWFGVLGGLAMMVFLVLATVLFHPVWEYSGDEQAPHLSATLTNIALFGGFLLIFALGF